MNKRKPVRIVCTMRTDFLYKGLGALSAAVVVGCCALSATLANAEEREWGKQYYVLLSGDTHVEAGAEFAQLAGGAGYLWTYGGGESVALSVYEEEAGAKRAQAGIKNSQVVCVGAEKLRFVGKEKKHSLLYQNALRTMEGCISVLSECIQRLDKGMTQESCKRLLSLLARQLLHAEEVYKEYGRYAQVCNQAGKRLTTLTEGTVYAKDLRYALCWQTEQYLRLCAQFR